MKNIFTIPNIISSIRLIIIPIFAIIYFNDNLEHHYFWAAFLLLLSGFSDIIDGFVARKFKMVSDLGKILDPIADKLTQVVIVLCLVIAHSYLLPMFIVLFFKELFTLFAAIYVLSNGGKPISAKWWGKLSTVVIFVTMLYAILIDVLETIPVFPIYVLIAISIICMGISVSGYFKIFSREVKGEQSK